MSESESLSRDNVLSESMEQPFYPELWEVRNRLTHRAGTSH